MGLDSVSYLVKEVEVGLVVEDGMGIWLEGKIEIENRWSVGMPARSAATN